MNTIITPEQIAAKLAAVKNLQAPNFAAAIAQEPRLAELLWFLQWTSIQPGGLDKFVQDLLALFPDRLGTDAMLNIGQTDEPYAAAERQVVIDSFPEYWPGQYLENESAHPGEDQCYATLDKFNKEMRGQPKSYFNQAEGRCEPDASFVRQQNHAYFFECCRRFAQADLPWLFVLWCKQPDACLKAPFYLTNLTAVLIEMLDTHAARATENIAMTKVAAEIFDALEFACAEKAMVQITGSSRFGKTEAIKAWCNAHPGLARLVKTPCDSNERSFFDAVAEALGCEVAYETPTRKVKLKIAQLLRYCGVMLVFDEAAWLLPQRFRSTTTPIRLNYIRSMALEHGCPVALVVTPQFYDHAAHRFEKITGYNMAQFKGRIMREITLAAELPETDLLAVVKIHFPDLRDSYAKRIVSAALMSESYLFAVEKISKNARAVAHKNGHASIELDDLEQGIALAGIRIPSLVSEPSTPSTPNRTARPLARRTAANPMAAADPLEAPARAITPQPQPL